jgi:hypothetical protein
VSLQSGVPPARRRVVAALVRAFEAGAATSAVAAGVVVAVERAFEAGARRRIDGLAAVDFAVNSRDDGGT